MAVIYGNQALVSQNRARHIKGNPASVRGKGTFQLVSRKEAFIQKPGFLRIEGMQPDKAGIPEVGTDVVQELRSVRRGQELFGIVVPSHFVRPGVKPSLLEMEIFAYGIVKTITVIHLSENQFFSGILLVQCGDMDLVFSAASQKGTFCQQITGGVSVGIYFFNRKIPGQIGGFRLFFGSLRPGKQKGFFLRGAACEQ